MCLRNNITPVIREGFSHSVDGMEDGMGEGNEDKNIFLGEHGYNRINIQS